MVRANICYIDGHCHCYEYQIDYLRKLDKYILVTVSDDLESSRKVLEYSRILSNIIPCVGIHPWSVGESSKEELEGVAELVRKYDVRCLGEVGLDTKFVAKTIDRQREFFKRFLELAREYDLVMNIHAAGTWNEVLELLTRYDIKKAIIHWYTGPLELIDRIKELGYFIGINPAWKIQAKHRRVIEVAPMDIIVTESDSPYDYRGLRMNPEMIPETIRFIAETKGISVETVMEHVVNNFKRLFGI